MTLVKVAPNEQQEFKSFDLEINDIDLDKRCELNDMMLEISNNGTNPSFSFWVDIILKFTKLKKEELNKYSTDEIVAIATTIFETANAKKK